MTIFQLPCGLTRNELRAIVVLPAGRTIADKDPSRAPFSVANSIITRSDDVLEGWIEDLCLPFLRLVIRGQLEIRK